MSDRQTLLITESELRSLIGPSEALDAIRAALMVLHRGEVSQPAIQDFYFPTAPGEAHVKGAHLHRSPTWTVKVSTGFYSNPALGLPTNGGLFLSFSANTGQALAVLLDNGYLTEVRTGAAGAVAADLLAPAEVQHALVVGAGSQARHQIRALLGVRSPIKISVWSRRFEQAAIYASEMQRELGHSIDVSSDLESSVRGADLIVTTTPSRSPLIRDEWVRAGTHVTAVGSDGPGKCELPDELLLRALLAADEPASAASRGELQQVIADGRLSLEQVRSLGEILDQGAKFRRPPAAITIADLVGLGVEDAAICDAAVKLAYERIIGTPVGP